MFPCQNQNFVKINLNVIPKCRYIHHKIRPLSLLSLSPNANSLVKFQGSSQLLLQTLSVQQRQVLSAPPSPLRVNVMLPSHLDLQAASSGLPPFQKGSEIGWNNSHVRKKCYQKLRSLLRFEEGISHGGFPDFALMLKIFFERLRGARSFSK